MLSALKRSEELKAINEKTYDLIIVGGGITGAGIALDAVLRGLKVALFEKQDFAQGTSSRSTKLVHGGLRYLEHLEFGVVKAVGRERKIVHENAMHIVLPEKMILPIIEGGSLGEFTTNLALKLYDFLADVKKSEQRKMLSKKEVVKAEPILESDFLKGGAMYYEYKTDDARLTIEILKKAEEHGAKIFNYTEVEEYLYEDNFKISGVKITDKLSGEKMSIYGKHVVNATGIWVDKMRKIDDENAPKQLHITKGIHIVVPKSKLPLTHSVYFDVGDNRMVFAIPRFNIVYIGTTDTNYDKNYEKPELEKKDIQYLIDAMNKIAPNVNLTINDVESVWVGLRPLIHQEGKAPSELSRKDEIFYSDSGLLSIAGGKLTGYRLMAKKVVDIIQKRIKKEENKDIGSCVTKNVKLSGGEFDFKYSLVKLMEYADNKYDEVKELGISVQDFKKLFYRYGKNIDHIINKAFEFYNDRNDKKLLWVKAEVWYQINYECILSISDYFIRRTGMIHFFANKILPILDYVADYMQESFGWTDEYKQQQKDDFLRDYKQATEFVNS